MKKLIAIARNQEEGERLLKAGADEIAYSLKGHSFTGLCSITIDELHACRSYSVFLNRFYFEEDLDSLKTVLNELDSMNLEHIYFSDPAVFQISSDHLRKKLIYRPMTLAVSKGDVSFWNDTGIAGVSISPLLTRKEVLEIVSSCPHTELTIHGNLLMSVSRRLLLTQWQKFSGYQNRLQNAEGLSIQESKRNEKMPIIETEAGTLIYSDFVQESFLHLNDFADAGAERFFLNPVFPEPEALIDAVSAYRKILNGEDAAAIAETYRKNHPELSLSEGYYEQPTIL